MKTNIVNSNVLRHKYDLSNDTLSKTLVLLNFSILFASVPLLAVYSKDDASLKMNFTVPSGLLDMYNVTGVAYDDLVQYSKTSSDAVEMDRLGNLALARILNNMTCTADWADTVTSLCACIVNTHYNYTDVGQYDADSVKRVGFSMFRCLVSSTPLYRQTEVKALSGVTNHATNLFAWACFWPTWATVISSFRLKIPIFRLLAAPAMLLIMCSITSMVFLFGVSSYVPIAYLALMLISIVYIKRLVRSCLLCMCIFCFFVYFCDKHNNYVCLFSYIFVINIITTYYKIMAGARPLNCLVYHMA
jgi:hypothetical protein